MAQQSLTKVNEIMPVIRRTQAWPYASEQHLARTRLSCKNKSNKCAGNAPGIQPSYVKPPNQFAFRMKSPHWWYHMLTTYDTEQPSSYFILDLAATSDGSVPSAD